MIQEVVSLNLGTRFWMQIFLNIWEHESSPGMDLDLMFTSPKSADSL